MKIFEGNFKDIHIDEDVSIALGTFDGVHRGHQAIIREAVNAAKEKNIKSAVFTFDRHPRNLLFENNAQKLITDNISKAKVIEKLGVDYLFFIKFDENLRDLEDADFIEMLVKNLKAKVIVCGYNYSFGKEGRGNPLMLYHYKDKLNYDLKVVERVSFGNQKISSTIIREKISTGHVEEASRLLGYNLFSTGEVVHGKGLAHTIGFPTANVIIDEDMSFRNGVYITLTYINNNIYPSITNVGYTPTLESKYRVMESYLFDFDKNIYGKDIKVEFLEFLREETKFSSVESLTNRVKKDIKVAKEYFKNNVYNF